MIIIDNEIRPIMLSIYVCIRNNDHKREKFLRNRTNISREEYKFLNLAKTLNEANVLVQ